MKLKRFISLGMLALAALFLLTSCPNIGGIESPITEEDFKSTYTREQVATPTVSFDSYKTYDTPQEVTLSCTTPGAVIYYNLSNDTYPETPTIKSLVYTKPITVSKKTYFSMIAVKKGMDPSYSLREYISVSLSIYNLAPNFSLSMFYDYDSAQELVLSNKIPGSTIYYTTDGSTPTTSSSVYKDPIIVDKNITITAIGKYEDLISGAITQIYSFAPRNVVFSFTDKQTVALDSKLTLSCPTVGAEIYYTLDGTNPSKTSIKYESPITISETVTIKAIAIKDNYDNSNIRAVTLLVNAGRITANYDATQLEDSDFKLNVNPTATTIDFYAGFDPLLMTIDQIVSPEAFKTYSFKAIKDVRYVIQWADSDDKKPNMNPVPTFDVKVSANSASTSSYFSNIDRGWTAPPIITANETETINVTVNPYYSGGQGIFYLSIFIYPTIQWYLDGTVIASATSGSYQQNLTNLSKGIHTISCVANAGAKAFSRSYQFYKN